MRVWWQLVRRSTTAWAGALVAALEVWLAVGSATSGVNLWADRVSGLGTASLYTGVIAAGFSALEAGRWAALARVHRRGAARTPALTRLLHASAAAAPILAGYLAALVILGVYAVATTTYGAPSAVWLVALGCALLGAVAFGWTIGSLGAGRWWAAPAGAMLFFGGYLVVRVLPLPDGIRALYPVMVVQDFVFVTPVLSTFLGMAAFVVGASLLALLLIGRGWRSSSRGRLVALSAIAGVLVVSGVAASLSRNGQYLDSFDPHDDVCSSGTVRICLNRGYAAALRPLVRQVTTMNARAAGTPLVAVHLQHGIEGGPAPRAGFRNVYVDSFAGKQDIASAVSRYVREYGASPACETSGAFVGNDAQVFVDAWLSDYRTWFGTPEGIDRFRALQAMTAAQGNAWFRAHYGQYSTCTLRLSDLP
ncbi:hypothetical protein [uncultured Amnibacterium sp.]|uniref:hypothetical protein n=1 Tax=uncultured Amnibacterium sp. TaxID=1631851 RepID=UPI0035CBA7D6